MTGKGGSDGGRAARFLPPQERRKGAHEERPYTRQRASFPLSRESRSEGCRRCDTRPYRSRPRDRYAGCMTGVRTAAIGRAYSSRPSYRQRLWLRRQLCFRWHPCTLGCGKQATALETPWTKDAKSARSVVRFTRGPAAKSARIRGRWHPWSGGGRLSPWIPASAGITEA